jgi:GNAT superfamily N-acetyltransferase
VQLSTIAPADYVRDVLPASSRLWAEGRTFEEYSADFTAIATSGYGRRRFRTTGLHIDGALVTSCKRYERELRCGTSVLRAAGLGAVFTPPELRGRGYATAMLGALLDTERVNGTDVVFLFSDIHPAFYERLGFVALPSRTFTLRADTLPDRRLELESTLDSDWSGVRRCFEALDARRTIAFKRTPLVWEWLRIATRSRAHEGQRVELCVKRGKTVIAYVFGRRIPRLDAFVVDEFAYTGDDGFDTVQPLLRNAAGDLHKITGWLPPGLARAALPRGAVRKRTSAIAMFAPLSTNARAAWRAAQSAVLADSADGYWATDHI